MDYCKIISIHKIIRVFLVICIVISSVSCVWWRLLELKHQIADFEKNIHVSVIDQHFVVTLHHPLLTSEDFLYLTHLRPSRVENTVKGYYWFLDFRPVLVARKPISVAHKEDKTITFGLRFTRENTLSAFDFSPLFLEIAPPVFLEASIRSLGAGKIDQSKMQLKVNPEDLPVLKAPLPKRSAVLAVLGTPFDQFPHKGLQIMQYRFIAESEPVSPEYASRREAEVKLFFDPAHDELVRLTGQFAGLKLAIDYRKLVTPQVSPH